MVRGGSGQDTGRVRDVVEGLLDEIAANQANRTRALECAVKELEERLEVLESEGEVCTSGCTGTDGPSCAGADGSPDYTPEQIALAARRYVDAMAGKPVEAPEDNGPVAPTQVGMVWCVEYADQSGYHVASLWSTEDSARREADKLNRVAGSIDYSVFSEPVCSWTGEGE